MLPAGERGAEPTLPAAAARADRTVLVRPSAQAQVLVGFLAPPTSHPDYAAVKVLATALGGGMAGRLFTEVRDKQGLAYSTGGAYPLPRSDPASSICSSAPRPRTRSRAEAAHAGRARADPARAGDPRRAGARQGVPARAVRAGPAHQRAPGLVPDAFFEALGVGLDFADRYTRAVEAVSAEDVLRVARTYLAGAHVVTLGPAAQ